MGNDSKNNNNENSFEYRLKEVSDEEIISILRYREHFQPQAVKDAIKEALKRGIISSIDDLDKEEFKPQSNPQKNIFPLGNTEIQNFAILKSLFRIYYLIGLLPLIYAFFLFRGNQIFYAISSLIIGITVIFIVYKLEKTKLPLLSQLLVALNVPAIIYAIYIITSREGQSNMDIAAIIIIILVLLYISLYINKIIFYLNKNNQK